MLEIFQQQGQRNNKKIQTLIYLLTDGAVSNTQALVDLVQANCSGYKSRVKVHTLGIGSGADEKLIKGCALAGRGNFTFIHKTE